MASIVRRSAGFTLFLWMVLVFLFMQWERPELPASGFFSHDEVSAMPLYIWLASLQAHLNIFVVQSLNFLLAFVNGFILMRLMVRNMVIQERSYLPVLIFLIAAFGTVSNSFSLIGNLVALLLIVSIDTMLASFRREIVLGKVFNSAFLAGTVMIIYPGAVIYIPILFCGMILLRKGGKEWLACLAGVVLPFLLCSYIFWALGGGVSDIGCILFSEVSARFDGAILTVAEPGPLPLALWGSALLLTAASLVYFIRGSKAIRTRPYKTVFYFFWIQFFTTLLLVAPGRKASDLFLMAVPLSVIIPFYLLRNNSTFATILYILFLVSAFANAVTSAFL